MLYFGGVQFLESIRLVLHPHQHKFKQKILLAVNVNRVSSLSLQL